MKIEISGFQTAIQICNLIENKVNLYHFVTTKYHGICLFKYRLDTSIKINCLLQTVYNSFNIQPSVSGAAGSILKVKSLTPDYDD